MGQELRRQRGLLIDEAITLYHQGRPVPDIEDPDIAKIFELYKADFGNDNVHQVQLSCSCSINGHRYIGRADQIRKTPKGLAVFEIKYSGLQPYDCVDKALLQLIFYAYCLDVRIGGVINVKNYLNDKPVHHIIDAPCPTAKQMKGIDYILNGREL